MIGRLVISALARSEDAKLALVKAQQAHDAQADLAAVKSMSVEELAAITGPDERRAILEQAGLGIRLLPKPRTPAARGAYGELMDKATWEWVI